MTHLAYTEAIEILSQRLAARGHGDAAFMAETTIWLEACGYAGLHDLHQALADPVKEFVLARTALGIDLRNISCAIIGQQVLADAAKNGRVYLRNVRHGLFLLAGSVKLNIGIGCPIDTTFALGGQRGKNPYTDKLELARRDGVHLDDELWQALMET